VKDSGSRTFAVILILLAVAGLIVHSSMFWRYTVDDAFISFRYARNLIDGHGLVFNPGERVEGYTNFLWTIIHSIVIGAGLEPEICAKYVNLALALGTMILLWLLGQVWGHGRRGVSTIALFFWVSAGAVAVAVSAGLETHLFTFLVTLGIYVYSLTPCSNRRIAAVMMIFSIASLVRPEGILFLSVTTIHYLFYASNRTRRLWIVIVPLALLLPFIAWKLFYYGTPVPNTLSAKTGGGWHQLNRGFGYIKGFVNEYGKPALFFFAFIPYLRRLDDRKRSYSFSILLLYLVYIVATGGDWIPHYRFLLPVFPLIYLSIQDGIIAVWDRILPRNGRVPLWSRIVFTGLLVIILFDIANQSHYLKLHTDMWANGYEHAHRAVGKWLSEHGDSNDTAALMDVGLIGYTTQMRILDITGLTDPYIAAAPGGFLKKTYPLDYLFRKNPEFIILVSASDYPQGGFGTSFEIDRTIFNDERFHERYEFVFSKDAYVTRVPHISGYYLCVFQQRDRGGAKSSAEDHKPLRATS